MPLLADSERRRLEQVLSDMADPVRLLFFTQTLNCDSCLVAKQIMDELQGLSDKLTVEEHNALLDPDTVGEYGVERVPAIVVATEAGARIRFYGAPSGYEFMSLVEAVLLASRGDSGLSEESRSLLAAVTAPVVLQVFVTPT